MKITNIKRSGNKYDIQIDNKKYKLCAETLIKNNILHPIEITEEEFNKLISTNNFYEGYFTAVKYLSFKQRSRFEIEKKLKTLGLSNLETNKIVEKLYEENYLNDNKFITSYINDAINLTKKGPIRIKSELEKLGIHNIKEEDIMDEKQIYCRVKMIVEKALKKTNKTSCGEFKKKISNELKRLGYSYNSYEEIINNISFNDDDAYDICRNKAYARYSKKYSGKMLESKVNAYLYSKGFYK